MDIIKNKKTYFFIATPLLIGIGLCFSGDTLAGNATTVQLAVEAGARKAADSAETAARIGADSAERAARTAADIVEATARKSAVVKLQAQIKSMALPPLPPGQFQVSLTRCGNSNTLQWGPCHYAVGDTGPAGGIVFHVTAGGMHGMEAAPEDQSANAKWGCIGTAIEGARGGNGAANTAAIVAKCADAGTAAAIASAYTLNDYSDWFLPSKDELALMYAQRNLIDGFVSSFYWSSSEFGIASAWVQGFGNPNGSIESAKNTPIGVRAIRAF